jgi:hypothetical protein
MKYKTTIALMFMFTLLILPIISADIIITTVTNVYFDQNGQAYNGNIEFTVKGYGYRYSVPHVEKEQGTYTPEVVFSFSAAYNNYGDKIYENYYRNYVHIDYYELEGKTPDGKTFVIKGISKIPTDCNQLDKIDESQTDEQGHPIEQVCELRFNLDDANWNGGDVPEPQPEPTPKPISEPLGFWSKIGCFFKRLFGGNC